MTPEKFNALNSLQQANFLWHNGIPVSELYHTKFSCALYQLEDFYVEVKFDPRNLLLHKITGFAPNCPVLDQYIKEIDISAVNPVKG